MSYGVILAVCKCQNHFQPVPSDLVPCSASSVQLCGIYCDWLVDFAVRLCNKQDCHSTRGQPPPKSPRPVTLPQSVDSAMPCTSESRFVFITLTEDFQEIHPCIWPYSVNIIKNSEHNKQPVYCLSLNTFALASQNTLHTCGWNLHTEVLRPQQTRDMFLSRGNYGVAPRCLRFTEHVAHWASWLTCQYNCFNSYQRVMQSHIIGSVGTQET